MKVEVRYPETTVGARGLRLFINGSFIPTVKEIKIKPQTVEVPTDDIKRTELGCEIMCKGIELIDDGTGLIAISIKEGE